jgi:acyl-CoA synthetase (AMP-forming)/AMP-acid ligase II
MRTKPFDTLIDKLLLQAEHQPHQPLYHFLDGRGQESASLTYGELLIAVQRLASWLLQNTEHGDRVAIQLPTGPEFVVTLFACFYTNRIPVPLSSPTRKHNCEHYQKIFADCNVRLAIADTTVQTLFAREDVGVSHLMQTFPALENLDPLTTPANRQGNAIAFLQYTSGSTSFPKGVMVSHENIIANQKMIQRTFGHSKNSIGLAWVPLFHDMGLIGSIFQPLYLGFPCYFMSPVTFLQRPKLWLRTISDKKITTTGGPNFAYDLCIKRVDPASLENLDLSSWEVAYNGAEHIKLNTLQKFSEIFTPYGFKKSTFLPCYGLAEATLIVSGVDKSEEPLALTIPCSGNEILDADASQPIKNTRTVVSNGQVMPELSLRIVNPQTLQECASHHIGEIWLSGPSITLGYWQKAEKNRETFVFHNGLRFLRTGDLGFLDSHHRLYITGRLKDLIVIDGTNYYPQDIEEKVKLSHPSLQEVNCAVFSIPSIYSQKLVIVLEVIRQVWQEIHLHADEIRAAVRSIISQHYQLTVHDIVLLPSNSIPKTTSGKIQRQRTRLLYMLEEFENFETVVKVAKG